MSDTRRDWQWFAANLGDYVLGEISDQDRRDMDAFIGENPRAMSELAIEISMRNALRAESRKVEFDVEGGLARLMSELDQARPRASAATPKLGARLRGWLDRLGTVRLAGVAAALIAVQAAFLATLIGRPEPAIDPVYRGGSAAVPAEFKVYPTPDAAYAQLAELFVASGCTVVAGPGEDGAVFVNCSVAGRHSQQEAGAQLRESALIADILPMPPR